MYIYFGRKLNKLQIIAITPAYWHYYRKTRKYYQQTAFPAYF